MINFLHTYIPRPEIFSIGEFSIHWYGLMIALGAFAGISLVVKVAKQYEIQSDTIYDLTFYLILVGILFERAYYVIYNWEYYSSHLYDIPQIWEGGLAIHGGMIAGILVLYFFVKKHKLNYWLLLDIIIVGLPLAMAIGRWGNYFNQELFGTPTSLPWGIPILSENRPEQFADATYFHPTFLYESILNFILLLVLVGMHWLRKNKKRCAEGSIALTFFIGYGIIRALMETLRQDYTPYFLGLRWAMFISFVIIAVAVALLVYRVVLYRKRK